MSIIDIFIVILGSLSQKVVEGTKRKYDWFPKEVRIPLTIYFVADGSVGKSTCCSFRRLDQFPAHTSYGS